MERLPTTESIAHLISKTLYSRRFFPYYTFNLVAGLDKDGRGVIYGYDAIGSYGPDRALAQGSGGHMIIPYLDAEFVGYNNPKENKRAPKSIEETVEIVYRAFVSAAERDIYTGDSCEIMVLDKNGVRKEVRPLRKDWSSTCSIIILPAFPLTFILRFSEKNPHSWSLIDSCYCPLKCSKICLESFEIPPYLAPSKMIYSVEKLGQPLPYISTVYFQECQSLSTTPSPPFDWRELLLRQILPPLT